MLRPLNIVKQAAPLMLGMALAAAFHAQPAFAAPQAPAAKAPSKAAPAAPATKPASKAQAHAKAPEKAKPKTHPPKPAPPKPAAAHHERKQSAAVEKKKEEEAPHTVAAAHGRDPFLALISGGQAHITLPPGKAGLQVSTLRVDGIVRSQNGMIVVVLNPQGRTYFLHQGDRLFDGRVEQISMDAVTFQETGKDPFGNAVERTVVKRVYPSAGEQQ